MNKKLKKFISRSMILSTVLSNISIASFAGTLSSDGRYEFFQGNNIKIDNILEPSTSDVEVYGNTLVNTLDYSIFSTLSSTPNSLGISINGKEITRDYSATTGIEGAWNSSSILIRKDVTYTFVVDIIKNTTSDRVELFPFMWRYGTQKKGSEFVASGYTGKLVVSFTSNADEPLRLLHENSGRDITGLMTISNIMLLRGDYYDEFTSGKSKIPNYFEGVQSVGQDNTINILSRNKNLLDLSDIKPINGYTQIKNGSIIMNAPNVYNAGISKIIENHYKKGNTYTLSADISNSGGYVQIQYCKGSEDNCIQDIRTYGTPVTYTVDDNYDIVKLVVSNGYTINTDIVVSNIQVEEGDSKTSYNVYQSNEKSIKLSKPLRSLHNGVEDRIIKKNGQWFVERNVGSLTLNDNHNVFVENTSSYYRFVIADIQDCYYSENRSPVISKDFFTNVFYNSENNGSLTHIEGLIFERYGKIYVYKTLDSVSEFRTWFKNNPQELLYRLNKPVYETLHIPSNVDIYDDVTYVSATCNTPTKLHVTVDRAVNRAKEFMEVAKSNPTVENISQARYWINLMKDSILKDEFQSDINSVFDIESLEIEKKTVSANVDVYIAMKNTLSMSLDTNSISFKGYTGSEDLEMLEALNITIDSSLQYSLNAYMPSGIYNSDKSKSMNINVLNLKESTESTYKQFASTSDKLILKENCSEGEAKVHSIDLKLSGGNTHKADVYKTVLKFEVEQK